MRRPARQELRARPGIVDSSRRPATIFDLASGTEAPDYAAIFAGFMQQDSRGLLLLNSHRQVLDINQAAREMLRFSGCRTLSASRGRPRCQYWVCDW